MKTVLSVDGIAVVLLVSVGLISAVDAVHAHHHGDIIGRIKHKTKASSSSSSNTTTIDASLGEVIRPLSGSIFDLLTSRRSNSC